MVTHADGFAMHVHTNTQIHIAYVTTHEHLCANLPPRCYISGSVYLVKCEVGRADSVLSAYFSKTINSVHKTHWSKTLKGKSAFSLEPVRLCSGRQ